MAQNNKCPVCGAELAPGVQFCTGCGRKLDARVEEAPVEQAAPAQEEPLGSVNRCLSCSKRSKEVRLFLKVMTNQYNQGNRQVTQQSITGAETGGLCDACFKEYLDKEANYKKKLVWDIVLIVMFCAVGALFIAFAKMVGWKVFGLVPIGIGLGVGIKQMIDERKLADRINSNTEKQNLDEFYGKAVEAALVKKGVANTKYIEASKENATMETGKFTTKYGLIGNMGMNVQAVILDVIIKLEGGNLGGAATPSPGGNSIMNIMGDITKNN